MSVPPTEAAQAEAEAPVEVRSVSVVIPAYNEGAHISSQIRAVRSALEETAWSFEILVVDDGSTDDTRERALTEDVTVVAVPRNRGYGAALKRGISSARYDWILIIDADGTYPAASIPAILEASPEADMVIGTRTGHVVRVPITRRPAKWILGMLASYLAGQTLPDINSGLRLMRRELVEQYMHLLPSGFSFTTTITLAAACNEHEVVHVAVDYNTRLGKSKIRPWHAYDFLLLILRTIVFFNPLKVFVPLGMLLALAGVSKFVYDITRANLSESALLGLLGALIVWAVGLLADQNARLQRKL